MEESEPLAIAARLLAGPDSARSERIGLLNALLERGGPGWDQREIAEASPLDPEATRRALTSLRRVGVLVWDQGERRDEIPASARPAVSALYLMARPVPEPELVAAQARLFALAGGRSERELIMDGLLEILRHDCRELEGAEALALEERTALAARLGRHVSDAERALSLAGESAALEEAIGLVARLASGVRVLLENLTDEGRDRMPRRRGASAREVRERIGSLSPAALAACLGPFGAPPRIPSPGDERGLVAALSGRRRIGAAPPPKVGALRRVAADAPVPDALESLGRLLRAGAPAELAGAVGQSPDWSGSLSVHHGFLRLHDRLRRHGGGLVPSGRSITAPNPHVARVSEAHAPGWQEAVT